MRRVFGTERIRKLLLPPGRWKVRRALPKSSCGTSGKRKSPFWTALIWPFLLAAFFSEAEGTLAQSAAVVTPCNPAISISSPSIMMFPDPSRKNAFVTDVLMRNDSNTALLSESATFFLFGFDGNALGSSPLTQMQYPVPVGMVQDLRLSLEVRGADLPVSGLLVLGATAQNCTDGAKQVALAFSIPSRASGSNSWLIVLITALAAMVGFAAVAVTFRKDLAKPMGPSEWSFSASAATNVTVAGTLLTTVLVSSAVPDNPHYLTKQGYFVLSSLFGAVVMLAPIFYNFCCRPTGPDPTNPQLLEFEGSIWLFLLSGGLTVWGVLGQLTTMSVMFQEFATRKYISELSVWSEWLVALSIGFSILFYCYRCVSYYVRIHPSRLPVAQRAQLAPQMSASMTSNGAPRWTAF